MRYRIAVTGLPGKPDIVVPKHRVAIFCDGDFWHGRRLEERIGKLRQGHNAAYWVEKIRRNVARDARNTEALRAQGWTVLRFWETEILRDPHALASYVADFLALRARSGSR